MDTMETIEVASGLSMEVKMLVAVCVVLATMLVLTMVSTYPYERQPATRNRGRAPRGTTRTAHTHPSTPIAAATSSQNAVYAPAGRPEEGTKAHPDDHGHGHGQPALPRVAGAGSTSGRELPRVHVH